MGRKKRAFYAWGICPLSEICFEVEFIENVKINKSNKPYPNKFYNLYGTPCMLVCSSNLFVFVAVPVSAQTERQAVDMVRNTNKFLKGKEKTRLMNLNLSYKELGCKL